ncbi:peptide methionine sulfoxide reductase MsrA [Photobacterium aphoticum]|uniref:Peptide methionine sulfoxide reductase MsrA n=1 Tax=Photobacterium aphoticum TaxID=754436 RepID=A0A090RHB0_9GAMM|nr:peptide methionine sulfoxide reductase MsrA [Photobacterium aphoticum]
MSSTKSTLPDASQALIGRATPIIPCEPHAVNGTVLDDTIPEGMEVLTVGMGCFWGAERLFWQQPGVYSTAVGYSGGLTPNPTYKEVCTGLTGHTEVVRVIFDPQQISLDALLTLFWEHHDPTQACAKVTMSAHNTARPFLPKRPPSKSQPLTANFAIKQC